MHSVRAAVLTRGLMLAARYFDICRAVIQSVCVKSCRHCRLTSYAFSFIIIQSAHDIITNVSIVNFLPV